MWTGTVCLAVALALGQPELQVAVELVGKVELGKAESHIKQMIAVDESTVLLVDTNRVQAWSFKEKTKPTVISSVENEHLFHELECCPFARRCAHADSTDSTAILFYSIGPTGQIEKTKVIDFRSQFKYGQTMTFAFSPSGSLFAYANRGSKFDHRAPITILETKTYGETSSIPYAPFVGTLSFLDEKLLLAVSNDGRATIWDVTKKEPRAVKDFRIPLRLGLDSSMLDMHHEEGTLTLVYHTPPVVAGIFTLRHSRLGLTEIAYGDAITVAHRTVDLGEFNWFSTCALSPDKQLLITGDEDAQLQVLDIRTSKARRLVDRKLDDVRAIRSIEYLDKDTFAVGSLGNALYVFSIRPRPETMTR